jgi:hypothetical protein
VNTDRLIRGRLRETFLFTLDTDEAFTGVLYAADRYSFVLRDAIAHDDATTRTPVDGELILPRDRVLYMQRFDPLPIR